MPQPIFPRLALASLLIGALLTAIFATLLIGFRGDLRSEIQRKIIERDAAVLYPMALLQMAEAHTGAMDSNGIDELLSPILRTAQQAGMIAVSVFDAEGNPRRAVPNTLLFVDLPVDDYLELTHLKPISRYHPEFRLDRTFSDISAVERKAPVLEVLIPLHHPGATRLAGVARYYIDARSLAVELATIDRQINQQTAATIAIATGLIALVIAFAYVGLRRAQRVIAERNQRLTRTNFELTLAVKTSALGQITSHLIHGLQGSVAGLRAVVRGRDFDPAAATDWNTAADYTESMQSMIQETVALLGDATSHAAYELTGRELAETVSRRNSAIAEKKGVALRVSGDFGKSLDSHRGGLLCLITNNLVQNAIEATSAGGAVSVLFRNGGADAIVQVTDEGPGIPPEIQAHLFEPGRTGRVGGTGLGLAISQLLARQIGATLALDATGPTGTAFHLTLPLQPA